MRKPWIIFFMGVFALLCLFITPIFGLKIINIREILTQTLSETDAYVFWSIRVPRVLTAFVAGASLAISGMSFQAMFRNPLATESTLGVASGASLGAAIYVRIGLGIAVLGLSGISVFAFAGAVLTILIVYGLSRIKQGFSTSTMLLAGVALSFFFSSIIIMIQSVVDIHNSFRLLRWLMGGLSMVGYNSIINILPFAVIGITIIMLLRNELNLLLAGDDLAISRGVDTNKVKGLLFFATSLTVGGIVAVCGPIGFVGMIVPHICRLIIGTDHKYLAPAVVLVGGGFLTICDTVARVIISPSEMPVGVITALLGGPFFIWLLITNKAGRI
ncbi:MAG: iron ABC transporter permease [Armatimonadota bacterium]